MIANQEPVGVFEGLIQKFRPVQERAFTVQYARPRSLGERIALWMEEQEAYTGKRPTFTAAAKVFNVHRTTISRNLKKYQLQA